MKQFKSTVDALESIPHHPVPDYTRPLLEVPAEARERMQNRLAFLYGGEDAKKWLPELERVMRVYYAHKPAEMIALEKGFDPAERFTERDTILITYGDLIRGKGHTGLTSLANFLKTKAGLKALFSTLHLLPFFPSSSDRGFSVVDFRTVDPKLGSWQDIESLTRDYKLMFDGVLNHISSHSHAFHEFLNGNPDYRGIVISYRSRDELTPEQRKILVRPRTSDILTRFESIDGPIWVWTTFSPDQIDLNYRNPKVLIFIIETLLRYVRYGADLIRLDAVTYLWTEPGTPSVDLIQTHEIIRLFRDVLDVVAPWVALVSETNVPHAQNISYFGDGRNEAQMVYNFALPPLVLHAFYREDATMLSRWAQGLEVPSSTTSFLNILDTHDGIGLMGVKDILPAKEIDFVIQKAREHGAFISYRSVEGAGKEPYEINVTWFSAMNHDNTDEDIAFQVKRFTASRSIALVLQGVPGIYLHGLVGTRNDIDAVLRTKSKRDINRRTLDEEELIQALGDPNSKLSLIAHRFGRLLQIRIQQTAFHPNGHQRVLMVSPDVFCVFRTSPGGDRHILALTNVTAEACRVKIPLPEIGMDKGHWYDLYGKRGWMAKGEELEVVLQPYDVVWLTPFAELERIIESGADTETDPA